MGNEVEAQISAHNPNALLDAVEKTLPKLEGAYALIIMHADFP